MHTFLSTCAQRWRRPVKQDACLATWESALDAMCISRSTTSRESCILCVFTRTSCTAIPKSAGHGWPDDQHDAAEGGDSDNSVDNDSDETDQDNMKDVEMENVKSDIEEEGEAAGSSYDDSHQDGEYDEVENVDNGEPSLLRP